MNKNDPKIELEVAAIQSLRKASAEPLTIFIGGVFGAGKTSLSYNLSCTLGIKQRSTLGMITKTLMYVNRTDPTLRSLNAIDRREKNYDLFAQQCKEICSVVNFITKVSRGDGTDLMLDGVQLNPSDLIFDQHTIFLFLKSGGFEVLKKQLNASTTHSIRYKDVNEEQVASLIELEEHLVMKLPQNRSVRVLEHVEGEDEQLLLTLKNIREWLTNSSL
jgi:2-phosphoglycerate kinase